MNMLVLGLMHCRIRLIKIGSGKSYRNDFGESEGLNNHSNQISQII